jgi:hypothetical protein
MTKERKGLGKVPDLIPSVSPGVESHPFC